MKRKHTGHVAGGAQISEDAALEVDPPRGLRGKKQSHWRQEDSDSVEDEDDPGVIEACECEPASLGAHAHVAGDGCNFRMGSRGCLFNCRLKWSGHTDECNEAYKALPDVGCKDRASWLAAGFGK